MAASPRKTPLPYLKPALFVGALVPLVDLVVQAALGKLGADAVAISLKKLGLLTLIFLIASLASTPLKAVTGWTWPIRVRRMLGLFAFFYGTCHVGLYVGVDQGFDWRVLLADVTQRTFILLGLLAWALMVPLAITSTDSSVRRLGFKRWKEVHRLAYVSGGLGVLHFISSVKKDVTEPALYAAFLVLLFLLRGWERWKTDRKKRLTAKRAEAG